MQGVDLIIDLRDLTLVSYNGMRKGKAISFPKNDIELFVVAYREIAILIYRIIKQNYMFSWIT